MSVINQMLKDLEARQRSGMAPAPVHAAISGSSRAGGGAVAGHRALIVLALAILLVSGIAIGWYLAARSVDDDVADSGAGPAVAEPPTASVPEMPPGLATFSAADPATPAMLEASPRPRGAPTARIETPDDDPPPSPPLVPAPDVPLPPAPPARQTIDRLPPPGDDLEDVRALLADGRASEAFARLDEASSVNPEAQALRATALQALGRHRDAIDGWTAALDRQPDVASWWVGLAISLEAEGRMHEALAAYARAGRHGPLEPALADYVRGRVDALSATPTR